MATDNETLTVAGAAVETVLAFVATDPVPPIVTALVPLAMVQGVSEVCVSVDARVPVGVAADGAGGL